MELICLSASLSVGTDMSIKKWDIKKHVMTPTYSQKMGVARRARPRKAGSAPREKFAQRSAKTVYWSVLRNVTQERI